ncbi:MAG: YkgJ family cysteine cluster protein [Candidatus Omnitrophica bacterium]|nr:YkgJ family cysteine cluster protein [Candidatus Omnitrophota bacterium]MDD5351663.1 YkgJ family cysteine cluster protein [Candidatus Omnitrophota bacterium]MDD5550873.1 YkgJ family cysteine cluster protein [Candidatus Omnitrophota bacterium]
MLFKQLVPQDFCLSCDVCCRFTEPQTIWAPLFTKEEIEYLVEKDILPPLVFTGHPENQTKKDKNKISSAQRINLVNYKDYFICPCFDVFDSHCKIYAERPFECQLYPFLLVRKSNKFYLAMDKKCPYLNKVQKNQLKTYTDYLRKEFAKKKVLSFLRQNQELFCEYPSGDLELLFSLDI